MSKMRNFLLVLATAGLMIPACAAAGEPPLKAYGDQLRWWAPDK